MRVSPAADRTGEPLRAAPAARGIVSAGGFPPVWNRYGGVELPVLLVQAVLAGVGVAGSSDETHRFKRADAYGTPPVGALGTDRPDDCRRGGRASAVGTEKRDRGADA
jgi:hypothetical protein